MKWTTNKERLLRSMWLEGKPIKDIYLAIGCSRASMMRRRYEMGLPRRNNKDNTICLRLMISPKLYQLISQGAKEFNSTKAHYIRQVLSREAEKL